MCGLKSLGTAALTSANCQQVVGPTAVACGCGQTQSCLRVLVWLCFVFPFVDWRRTDSNTTLSLVPYLKQVTNKSIFFKNLIYTAM